MIKITSLSLLHALINYFIFDYAEGLTLDILISLSILFFIGLMYYYLKNSEVWQARLAVKLPQNLKEKSAMNKERWLLYFLLNQITLSKSQELGNLAYLFVSLLGLLASIQIVKPLLKESKSHSTFKFIKISFLLIFISNLIFNVISEFILTDVTIVNNNQDLIKDFLKNIPFKMILEATILAAFHEEIVYRGLYFRQVLPYSRVLAYLLTFIMFSVPHIIPDLMAQEFTSALINLPIYGVLALILAFSYERSNSIYTPMIIHLLNNSLALAALLSTI